MKAPATAKPPRLGQILETSLYTDDLDKAGVFYQSVLGLDLFAKEAGRHVFFKCGDGMLLVFNPAKTVEESDAVPHGAHGPGHVAFAVPMSKLDAWKSYLINNGVEVEKDVKWPNGGRSLYFRDPAGNSIELASPLLWGVKEAEA
jgi:catechol 2,3-dioxygenase-like lactoylglutathione lyase family enzyme